MTKKYDPYDYIVEVRDEPKAPEVEATSLIHKVPDGNNVRNQLLENKNGLLVKKQGSITEKANEFKIPEYDPNVDYAARMSDAIKRGDYIGGADAERLRNLKIQGEGLDEKPTNRFITANDGRAFLKPYDPDTDYMALMQEAIARGDWGTAAEYERLRNLKIQGEGRQELQTHNYNYDSQYDDEKNRTVDEIKNFKPFTYDPNTDPAYLAMRAQKEKEADAAYKDAYARLAAQNGGEVPADMLAQLEGIRQSYLNEADSYMLTLRQMAYDMYGNEKADLYNRLGILDNMDNTEYGRFADNRNMFMQGSENAYNRDWNREQWQDNRTYRDKAFETQNEQWNKSFEAQRDQWERTFERQNEQWDKSYSAAQKDAIINYAQWLYTKGLYGSIDAAVEAAQEMYANT